MIENVYCFDWKLSTNLSPNFMVYHHVPNQKQGQSMDGFVISNMYMYTIYIYNMYTMLYITFFLRHFLCDPIRCNMDHLE